MPCVLLIPSDTITGVIEQAVRDSNQIRLHDRELEEAGHAKASPILLVDGLVLQFINLHEIGQPNVRAHRRGPATRESIVLGAPQRAGSRPVHR